MDYNTINNSMQKEIADIKSYVEDKPLLGSVTKAKKSFTTQARWLQ